jgi:hypothetical protein
MLGRFWTLAARGGGGRRGVGGLCGVRGGYLVEARGVLARGLLRGFIFGKSLFCFDVAALCRSVDQDFLAKCEDVVLAQVSEELYTTSQGKNEGYVLSRTLSDVSMVVEMSSAIFSLHLNESTSPTSYRTAADHSRFDSTSSRGTINRQVMHTSA